MNKAENEVLKVRRNSPIIFTVILIMVFTIAIGYMAFYQLGVFRIIETHNSTNETAEQDIVPDSTAQKLTPTPKLADNYNNSTLGTNIVEAVIAPYSGHLQNINEHQNTLHRDELIKAPDLSANSPNSLPHKNTKSVSTFQNDYRNYLMTINLLTANFLQGKHYREQIYKIQEIELPPDIQNILEELLNYHEHYLFNNNAKIEKIFPLYTCWLEKFIKVERTTLLHKDQEILKHRIMTQLDFLINYFYSQKFQQKFIEQTND
ncbi:hypothetical protein [Candidatus Tisiphia endosymbiont of Beris chalybata]|uniref:hypothetical protein n=1 Tax=Candidatus Tisiphia endosymbiont of Beris chalybata TaxID=3066262 RepID=UPI00312CC06F